PQNYIEASRSELDLSEGAKGQRVLARMALFQWLKKGKLLSILEEEHTKLLEYASIDDTRQIIIFADRSGGVGSGWMIDIARLLRRIARQQQGTVPEIISVLSSMSQQTPQQQHNSQALDKELETAQLSGGVPQQITYLPDDTLLDKIDTENPFNALFSVIESKNDLAAVQSASLGAVLVERYPRLTVFNDKLHQGQIVSWHAKGIHVKPDLNYQLVKQEILLQLLGSNILLDLELDDASKKLMVTSVADPDKLLSQWHKACEPKGTPWHLLLNALMTPAGINQFFQVMREKGHPDAIWFQQAFIASLNQQMRGYQNQDRWIRTWMPGETIIGLRLFSTRVTDQVIPQASQKKLADILTELATLAQHAANHLEEWLKEFIPLCEHIGKQKHTLNQNSHTSPNLDNQIFIDQLTENKQRVTEWAEKALSHWVGKQDVTSALCKNIFFTARLDKNDVMITLATYVEDRQEFSSAKSALKHLEHYAKIAAQQVPTLKIEGALAEIDAPKDLKTLALKLVDSAQAAEQVVIVSPIIRNNSQLLLEIVNPVGQALAKECQGNDHSAIRRIALRT
ncbi:MAG: hypothetical protein KAH77_06260, partial [Thiomargarita sp.]|nr:hypothetical protein [Thiomargarita sp.]